MMEGPAPVSRLGLDPRASYRVDDRTGIITQVAVPVMPQVVEPEHVHEPVAVEHVHAEEHEHEEAPGG